MKEAPEIDLSQLELFSKELEDPVKLRENLFKKYGGIAKSYLGDFPNYYVMDPDYVQVILSEKQDDFFTRHPVFRHHLTEVFGTEALFVQSDPAKWNELRRIALMSMDVAVFFERYVNASYEVGKKQIDKWSEKYADGDRVNMFYETDCLITSFINHSFFYHIDEDPAQYRATIHKLSNSMYKKAVNFDAEGREALEINEQYKEALKPYKDLFKGWVQERLDSGRSIDDFLGLMINYLSKTFQGEDLVNEVTMHVSLASSGALVTSSPALHYLLIELARRPDVADKVREEIHQIVGDGVPTYEHLKKMDYCSAVIKESQRLNTNVYNLPRQASVDTSIRDYRISKGSGILIALGQVHRHPKYWKDPDVFNPQRFLDKPMGQDHLYAYVPFGGGKRACIARHLIPLDFLVALIVIMRNYNLEYPSENPVENKLFGGFFLLRPKEEHLILKKI